VLTITCSPPTPVKRKELNMEYLMVENEPDYSKYTLEQMIEYVHKHTASSKLDIEATPEQVERIARDCLNRIKGNTKCLSNEEIEKKQSKLMDDLFNYRKEYRNTPNFRLGYQHKLCMEWKRLEDMKIVER